MDYVTLYTIQNKKILPGLLRTGRHIASTAFTLPVVDKDFDTLLPGYEYLSERLTQKIEKPKGVETPIWCSVKPISMKAFTSDDPSDYVRLKLRVRSGEVLFHDAMAYYHILYEAFYTTFDELYDYIDILSDNGTAKKKLVKWSWQKIFNVKDSSRDQIHACIWEIKLEDIRDILIY